MYLIDGHLALSLTQNLGANCDPSSPLIQLPAESFSAPPSRMSVPALASAVTATALALSYISHLCSGLF